VPTKHFTARVVDAIKADPSRQVDYFDSSYKRFGLRVSPGGRKTWIVFYRHNGRPRRMSLGTYPETSLAKAREKARDALTSVDDGTDPAVAKVEERLAETFGELARVRRAAREEEAQRP
jgi:hypothetical protein